MRRKRETHHADAHELARAEIPQDPRGEGRHEMADDIECRLEVLLKEEELEGYVSGEAG